MSARETMAGLLSGDGIEIGALNAPLELGDNGAITRLRYVDRYQKDELLQHFPELEAERDRIVETDICCDIIHGLAAFGEGSLDFVIACHLIEHVPDPIFFLRDIERVLRPGARLMLALPDKDFSGFDIRRPLTPLEHLREDNARGVRVVEDHHLEEFLRLAENLEIPTEPSSREQLFRAHRERSIHIHIWNSASFSEFLADYLRESALEVVAHVPPHENERREILYVLEKRSPAAGTKPRSPASEGA